MSFAFHPSVRLPRPKDEKPEFSIWFTADEFGTHFFVKCGAAEFKAATFTTAFCRDFKPSPETIYGLCTDAIKALCERMAADVEKQLRAAPYHMGRVVEDDDDNDDGPLIDVF